MQASVSLSKLVLERKVQVHNSREEQSAFAVTVLQLCVVCGLKTIQE